MSRLQLFPPVVTVYPNDKQLFTARAVPPPAMWFGVINAQVQSDFSLLMDAIPTQLSGVSAHRLFSGSGFVEWTMDDFFRPTGVGQFIFRGRVFDVSSFEYIYNVEVNTSSIVIRDEASNVLYNQPHTATSGDVLRLELSSGFRLFRNGVLLHSRVNLPTQISYPIHYDMILNKPVAAGATAKVPPPRLVGDWRLHSVVNFTTPSHGSLSTTGPALQTQYSGGTTPGSYPLAASIDAAHDPAGHQKTVAIITIPPLSILGPTEITLRPGQKARFKTNYDAAQTALVTWSVVSGGGSFTQGEFTAPSTPGTTVVRATAAVNSQIAQITITVPAVISATAASLPVTAAAPGEALTFSTNMTGTITWTASIGTAGPVVNPTFAWTAPSLAGQTARVTATNGTLSVTIEFLVLEAFPLNNPTLPIIWDRNLTALISMSEDRKRRSTRDKSPSFDSYELKFTQRLLAESNNVDAFFDAHGFGKLFILEDKLRGIRKVGWFDSPIRHEGDDECAIDLSFRFLEARL